MGENIDVILEDHRWNDVDLEDLAAKAAWSVFDHLNRQASEFEIVVLGTDDARIADLNASFRGKSQPTNVLSWPSQDRAAPKDGDPPALPEPENNIIELGDIALAYEICVSEAKAAHKSLSDHSLHLLVHGILHLLGYDHIRDNDAALMESLEVKVLASMGLEDPYS